MGNEPIQEEGCDQVNTPLYQTEAEQLGTAPTLSLSWLSSFSLFTESRPSVNTNSSHAHTNTKARHACTYNHPQHSHSTNRAFRGILMELSRLKTGTRLAELNNILPKCENPTNQCNWRGANQMQSQQDECRLCKHQGEVKQENNKSREGNTGRN